MNLKRKMETLQQSLPAIVSAVGRKHGVKVVYDDGPPRTNGDTVYCKPLPVNLANTDPSKAIKILKMILGDVDHETAHILYSKFGIAAEILLKALWNACEDTMVERLMGDEYLGCRSTLSESVEIAIELGLTRTGLDSPSDTLICYVDFWGRKMVLNQKVDCLFEPCKIKLEETIGSRGVILLNGLLSQYLFSTKNSFESLALAKKIIKLLNDIASEPEQESQAQNNQPQDSQTGDSHNSQDSNSSSGSSNSEQNQTSESLDNSQKSSSKSSSSSTDQSAQSSSVKSNNSIDDSGQSNSAKGAGDILNDQNVNPDSVIDRRKIASDLVEEVSGENFVPSELHFHNEKQMNQIKTEQLKKSILAEANLLARKLEAEFQTKNRSRFVSSEEGRLDSRRIHLAAAGNPMVFKKKKVSTLPKPAVSLLLDLSGSMSGQELELTVSAALAMGQTLSQMNVKFEINGYSSCQGFKSIVKFGDTWQRVVNKLGALNATGGTPTADALWIAANRLVSRPESRKIMLLVTDGEPDNEYAAKQVADMIIASNIELYGIGIQVPHYTMSRFCSNYGCIQDSKDIAKAILGALSSRILKAA